MDPSPSLLSGGEWPARKDYFSKLGDYFDRPNWWDEGAQAIGDFFSENKPPVNSPDKRLEDLLQCLEPFTVVERPVRSNEKKQNGSGPHYGNVALSSHSEQHLSGRNSNFNQTSQSRQDGRQAQKEVLFPVSPLRPETAPGPENNDDDTDSSLFGSQNSSLIFGPAETETTKSSNDLPLQKDILIDAALQRSNECASSNINNDKPHSQPFGGAFNERSLPKLGATIANGAIATSSPVPTGTTTSTRQTSIQPESSTRVTSVSSSSTTNISISPEKNASPSASFEKNNEPLTTPEVPHESTRLLQDDVPILSDDLAIPTSTGYTVHDDLAHEDNDDVDITAAATQIDPTGLQAIKDEFSEQYGLEPGHDSSFLSQDDDVTVVHDPSSAALSFFPPNPYSADPVEYDYDGLFLTEGRAVSLVQDALTDHVVQDASLDKSTQLPDSLPHERSDEKDHVEVQDTVETSTAPEILPVVYGFDALLPHGEQLLPTSFLEESNDQAKTRAYTPPGPPTSPLTPLAEYLGTRPTENLDAVSGAAEQEEDDVQNMIVPSTPSKATATGKSWSGKVFGIVNKIEDELAQDMLQDQAVGGSETSTASADVVKQKRKQDQPHPDEPLQKRRVSAIPENDDQPAIDTIEATDITKKLTKEGKSKSSVQIAKDAPVARSYHSDSADELALTYPDAPVDPPTSNPFALNKGKDVLSLTKTKPKRSTPSRSGAKKAATTTNPPAAVSKMATTPKTTRRGVSNEVARLLDSSPPRKEAEKTKAHLGSRLRSQSNTPAPAATRQAAPIAPTRTPSTSKNSTTTQPKRQKGASTHPLASQELSNLGPVAETETRTRHSTIAPIPEFAPESSTESAPKRVRNAIPGHDLDNLGTVLESRTRSRNSSVEPASGPSTEPKAKLAPPKRVRKPAVKPAAKPVTKTAVTFGSLNLASRSNGAPAASRRKTPAKKKAAEPDQEEETPAAGLGGTKAKRKRQNNAEDAEEGATRQSKRIAGAKGQEE